MKIFFLCGLIKVLITLLYSLVKKTVLYFVKNSKYNAKNPTLDLLLRPIEDELTIPELTVRKGEIPSDLNGYYVRNGPNPHFEPRGSYHLFDGDGMLHSVHLEDGTASYMNRWVHTEKFLVEEKHKRSIIFGLNEILSPIPELLTFIDRYWNGIVIEDGLPSNTSVVFHANKLLSLHEAQIPYEIDIETLGTKTKLDLNGKWTKSFTAHPKIDPDSGEMHFFSYDLGVGSINYGIMDKEGKLLKNVYIKTKHPTMIHDFVLTTNYVVFNVSSLIFKKENFIYGKSFFEFDKNVPSYFGILPRTSNDSKDMKWFETLPSTTFHFSNGYENDSEIIIHGSRMSDFDMEDLDQKGYLYEWKFNLQNFKVSEKPICHIASDFPVINPKNISKKYQYIFSVSNDLKILIKTDLENLNHRELTFGEKTYILGEFLFVPKKNGKTEDDGYLMAFVHNIEKNQSLFIIVDGKNFELVCEIDIPRRIPNGFHGTWVNTKPKTKFEKLIEQQIEEVKKGNTPVKKVEFKEENIKSETPVKFESPKKQSTPEIKVEPPLEETPKKDNENISKEEIIEDKPNESKELDESKHDIEKEEKEEKKENEEEDDEEIKDEELEEEEKEESEEKEEENEEKEDEEKIKI